MPSMRRLPWVGLVLPLFGCVMPFVHSHREQPQAPAAVQRFSHEAQARARATGAPGLPDVTRSMGDAIEALPDVKGGDQLAQKVLKQADEMRQRGPDQTDALARASLEAALEAVRRAKPAVPQRNKDQAIEVARHAIEKIEPGHQATVDIAYQDVAHAMVVVTGGRAGAETGSELSQLVARFAVEEPDDARRTGAQAIAVMGDELPRLALPPEHASRTARELRKRADRLATAPALEYAGQLKDALSLVVGSLDRATASPAERRLLDEAKVSVGAIRADRPLDLQQAAAAAALRLVTDAITVSLTAR
jgi:hypothetical protein